MSEFLKPAEVASKLHVTPRTLRTYLRRGAIQAIKLEGRWLIPASAIDQLLAEHVLSRPSSENT
jgi:excisionase family DNA binding protein